MSDDEEVVDVADFMAEFEDFDFEENDDIGKDNN